MRIFFAGLMVIFLLASCEEQIVENPPPASYQLKQNYPNPFTDTTVIEYGVPSVAPSSGPHVRVVVYDRYSVEQIILADELHHNAGIFRVYWRPYNDVPAGLYYAELQQVSGTIIGITSEPLKRIAIIKK